MRVYNPSQERIYIRYEREEEEKYR